MTGPIIVVGILLFFIMGVAGWVIGIYNGLVALKNNVDQAWSNIDVILKQRHNELTKLLEVVKGVKNFEQETLIKVTQARAMYDKAGSQASQQAGAQAVSGALKGLFAVAEAYPELKANQNFTQLQSRISELEEQIADRREMYNDTVNFFNTRIEQFPDTLVASMLNYRRRRYFRVDPVFKQDVKIHF